MFKLLIQGNLITQIKLAVLHYNNRKQQGAGSWFVFLFTNCSNDLATAN